MSFLKGLSTKIAPNTYQNMMPSFMHQSSNRLEESSMKGSTFSGLILTGQTIVILLGFTLMLYSLIILLSLWLAAQSFHKMMESACGVTEPLIPSFMKTKILKRWMLK